MVPFIGVGVQYGLSVDYFKLTATEYRKHFGNAIAVPLVMCILFTLLCVVLFNSLQHFLKVNLLFILLLPFTGLLTVFSDVILNLVRNKEKHYLFAGISISKNLLEITTTLLLVIVVGMAWSGRLGSSIIALSIVFVAGLFLIKKWNLLSFQYDRKLTGSIIYHGLPFVPERLAIFVLGYSDRFFINHYNETADVGFYGAGAQIAIVVNMLILTLNNVSQPSLFKELATAEINYRAVRRQSLFFIGMCIGVTAITLAATPLLFRLFIGETFQPGIVYAINLTIANAFWGVYSLFLCFLLSLRKNRLIMSISILSMCISLLGNFFNVRYFGPIGATYTTMIVYFFMAAISAGFVHKYFGLQNIFFRKPINYNVIPRS